MIGWISTCYVCYSQSHGLVNWMVVVSFLVVVLINVLSCFLEDDFTIVFGLRALKLMLLMLLYSL